MQIFLLFLSSSIASGILIPTINAFKPIPKQYAHTLGITVNTELSLATELNKKGILASCSPVITADVVKKVPLFKQFPTLAHRIAYLPYAQLPTPVEPLDALNEHLAAGCKKLYSKRDDLTGLIVHKKQRYGGNKVRKLEFLLGQAEAHHAQEIITFGAAGSNHAVATALYAHQSGFGCTNVLMPQINSPVVQQNLLHAHSAGAKILYCPDHETRLICAFSEWLNTYNRTGIYPYMIPKGGSNPIGTLGFVNAAYELKEQIEEGLLEKPDVLYVALGSCGTAAGLALGFQLAGLTIPLVAVATEPREQSSYQQELEDLYQQTNSLLHEHDHTIPLYPFPKELITVRVDFTGTGYGMASPEGLEAQTLFKKYAKITLDNTYTSKAAAALLADIRSGLLADKKVLFWNTYCGLDFGNVTSKVSYKDLPVCFHSYFI